MDATAPLDFGAIARELNLPLAAVERTVALLDQGNTVPFVTRYRKDHTGGLDEVQIRRLQEHVGKIRLLWERKQTILKSIEGQERLTPELAAEIEAAQSLKLLEDLYLPYRPKKQSLATLARERGLEPLAREIYEADAAAANLEGRAADFVNADKQLPTVAEVLLGVGHLIAERISEKAEIRGALRRILRRTGKISCTRLETEERQSETPAAEAAASGAELPGTHGEGELPAAEGNLGPAAGEAAEMTETGEISESAPESELHAPENEADSDTDSETETPELATDSEPVAHEATSAGPPAVDEAPAVANPPCEGVAAPPVRETLPQVAAAVVPPSPARSASAGAKAERKKREKLVASFKDYFAYQEELSKVPPHRVLAINRGERARVIRVKLEADYEGMDREALCMLVPRDHPQAEFLANCVRDGLQRLLIPSLEREVRRELAEKAEEHSVEVFARNLRKLLLQPPVRGRRVLALDPGYKSGCKAAALDQFGNVLGHAVIPVVGNDERRKRGRQRLAELVTTHDLAVVAIGNGTACRETEKLVAQLFAEDLSGRDLAYCFVNEAGASVYSTSPAGREELPGVDATLRSAVSIGRRLLDPLSELVKINPANIGVGLYQHDVKGKHLQTTLDAEVESCVNYVGVDVNTASPALLRYVSGLNQLSARKLYEYRCEHGPFKSREQFKEVPNIGEATFVQAAGFLKISDGDNPLDATWIHPESYVVAQKVLEKLGSSVAELRGLRATPRAEGPPVPIAASEPAQVPPVESAPAPEAAAAEPGAALVTPESQENALPASAEAEAADLARAASMRAELVNRVAALNLALLSSELGVGQMLLQDILTSLTRPGRDPRDDLPPPVFRRGIVKLEDLAPGMELMGTVLNVVDFGAFVDIGLADSGLVHISRLADRFIKDPHEVVGVGDVLKVWVVDVDMQRRRVSLTAIQPGTEKTADQRRAEHAAREPRPQRERPERRPARRRPPAGQAASGAVPQGAAPAGGAPGAATPPQRFERSSRPPRSREYSAPQGRRGPPPSSRPPAPRPSKPKPVRPITKAMEEGREPLRSFSDLAQFWARKSDAPGPEPKTPPPADPPAEPPAT